MALIPIHHPGFTQRRLVVKTRSWIRNPTVFLDGVPLRAHGSTYRAVNDDGDDVEVKLKTGFDPIPRLEVDGTPIELARPLTWYEYLWAGWPVALIALGGALGGAFGAGAFAVNVHVMRLDRPKASRYLAALAVALLAVAAYIAIAVWAPSARAAL